MPDGELPYAGKPWENSGRSGSNAVTAFRIIPAAGVEEISSAVKVNHGRDRKSPEAIVGCDEAEECAEVFSGSTGARFGPLRNVEASAL